VSSRNERAQQNAARPEDFMDEEDLQEIRDSMKFVDNRDQMDFEAATSQKVQLPEEDE
jgi:G patch domain-containing protein 1